MKPLICAPMVEATGGRRVSVVVRGPLNEPVEAFFGLSGDGTQAVIEMAAASGLALVPPEKRNPLRTTSYGTGQLIRAALDAGARRFVLGIGGSATNDGGAGMAARMLRPKKHGQARQLETLAQIAHRCKEQNHGKKRL